MTEPRNPVNPIVARRQAQAPVSIWGTDHSRAQLQSHCDMLNNLGWVQASRKPYLIVRGDGGKLMIVREGERQEKPS